MYVYQITNLKNGKQYIGITNDYKKRWSNHRNCNSPNMVICKAIKKYGVENFKFELLFEGLSLEQASLKEIELIKEKNTLVPNGYNVAKGGFNGATGIQKFGEENSNSKLTNEEAQYIKDHRNIPEYVLYEKFSEKISYDAFKQIYLDKTYLNIKPHVGIYPFNLEFSNQFTSNNKLTYNEVVELRNQYKNKVYWRDAYEKYKDIFKDEWSFWNIYVGNKYKLVMPEVFTPELKHYHSSLSKQGPLNGRAKLTWDDVREIRRLSKEEKISNSELYKLYPQISATSIRNIINNKTWKE